MDTITLYRHSYNNPYDAKRDFLSGLAFKVYNTTTRLCYHDLSVLKGAGVKTIEIVWNNLMPPIKLKAEEI
jgi:hypothetical protein